MGPVGKTLWFIESNFAADISLAEIADVSGVSRYHLARAFGATTGYSVMRYVRARRLTEAARALAAGAPDILAVALDSGYGSHEAFTRAFGDQFDVTPESVRAQRRLDNLKLVEPIRMDNSSIVDLAPPRFADHRAMRVAGLGERYTFETNEGIPKLCNRFKPHIDHAPGQVGSVAYGVCRPTDADGSYEYVAGVEVSSFAGTPANFSRVEIPAARYAVFIHRNHISTIRSTIYTI